MLFMSICQRHRNNCKYQSSRLLANCDHREISPLKINYMLIMKRGICYQNVFRQIDGVRSHERLHSTGKVPNGVK